jgi:hypothetical protein
MSGRARRRPGPAEPLGAPVPGAEPGVCATCHGPARDGRVHCWCCRSVARTLGVDRIGPVVPMALFARGDPLHVVLRGYKDAAGVAARRQYADRLGAHARRFLGAHAACLVRLGGSWDAVAAVPSSRGRVPGSHGGKLQGKPAAHPMARIIGAVPALSSSTGVVLHTGTGTAGHLAPDRLAFAAPSWVAGRRVLLLDDTWVTGARMASAAVALRTAGATVVAMAVLGRLTRPPVPGIGALGPAAPCCLWHCRLRRSSTAVP